MVAINETWRLAPWADALYACDAEWWKRRGPKEFEGLKIAGADPVDGCVFAEIRKWLPKDSTMNNGGAQALVMFAAMGAKTIILTGFDCGGAHWHDQHGPGLNNPREESFKNWRRGFRNIAPILAGWGCEVINASRETTIDAFPRMKMETALCK